MNRERAKEETAGFIYSRFGDMEEEVPSKVSKKGMPTELGGNLRCVASYFKTLLSTISNAAKMSKVKIMESY